MSRKITLLFSITLLVLGSVRDTWSFFSIGSYHDARNKLLNPDDDPKNTRSPINVITPTVKEIITPTPLQGYQGLFEILNFTNRGNIIEAYLMPDDHSYITGGLLGHEKYKLDLIRIYVSQNPFGRSGNTIDGLGGPLEPTVIYRSTNYSTLAEAAKHPGGVVQLSFCVVTSPIPTVRFSPVEKALGKIKNPGSSTPILGTFAYMWFDHILQFRSYFAYTGSYSDIESGEEYPGSINIIPVPQIIGLGLTQFKAFQNVKGFDGKPIEAIAPIYKQGERPVYHAIGVIQKLHFI